VYIYIHFSLHDSDKIISDLESRLGRIKPITQKHNQLKDLIKFGSSRPYSEPSRPTSWSMVNQAVIGASYSLQNKECLHTTQTTTSRSGVISRQHNITLKMILKWVQRIFNEIWFEYVFYATTPNRFDEKLQIFSYAFAYENFEK